MTAYVSKNAEGDKDHIEYFGTFDTSCKRDVQFNNQTEKHIDIALLTEKLRSHFNALNPKPDDKMQVPTQ